MASKSAAGLTYNETAHAIAEFLEVAIHNIIYIRQLYPVELFTRRKKYDMPVWRSRHPELNEYISGAVKAVGEELIFGNVEKIVVIIKDHNEVALERFIFAVKHMITLESRDRNERIVGAISGQTLSQCFRSFLVKLSMMESQLGPLMHNENASFAIVLELQDDKVPLVSQSKGNQWPWIPAMKQHTTEGASDEAELHVVRAVDTGVINISLAVQESPEKLKLLNDWLGAKMKGKGKAVQSR